MQTNATVTLYRKARDWKQELTTSEIGSFDVWLEFGTKVVVRSVGGQAIIEEIGKGMIFLLDDIDLTDAYFIHENEQYDISLIDGVFRDRQQNFHHIEAYFK